MPVPASQSRLLEHITVAIHDLREDLAQRITEGNATVTRHLDRLSERVDAQGERLSKVETQVDHLQCSYGATPPAPTTWKRDGALVLSGGGVLAVLDALMTWVGTHWPK